MWTILSLPNNSLPPFVILHGEEKERSLINMSDLKDSV